MKNELSEKLKSHQVFRLQTKRSKAGTVSLYLVNYCRDAGELGLKVAQAGGYGYDKIEACLSQFFEKIGYSTKDFIHLGLGSNDLANFLAKNQLKMETHELLEGYLIILTKI